MGALLNFFWSTCMTFVMQGCAVLAPENPEGWESFPRWQALPPVYKQVDSLWRCASPTGYYVLACAWRDWSTGLCWILSRDTEDQLPRWLKEHEEKHCKGYDHAAPGPIVRFTK